jgi:hypothetical protein
VVAVERLFITIGPLDHGDLPRASQDTSRRSRGGFQGRGLINPCTHNLRRLKPNAQATTESSTWAPTPSSPKSACTRGESSGGSRRP